MANKKHISELDELDNIALELDLISERALLLGITERDRTKLQKMADRIKHISNEIYAFKSSTEKEDQLKNAQKQITELERDLRIEKALYTNMKNVLKKRQDEIVQLNSVINDLLKAQ